MRSSGKVWTSASYPEGFAYDVTLATRLAAVTSEDGASEKLQYGMPGLGNFIYSFGVSALPGIDIRAEFSEYTSFAYAGE